MDHGWLRLLGGDGGQLPSLAEVNTPSSGLCIVGFDVLSGVFALDGGALEPGDRSMHYSAPASLEWEDLEIAHSHFVAAMLSDAIDRFYEPFRRADGLKTSQRSRSTAASRSVRRCSPQLSRIRASVAEETCPWRNW